MPPGSAASSATRSGAKLPLRSPELIATIGLGVTMTTTLFAAVLPGLAMATVVGFVGSTSSSLAKVCLDSVIQRDMPEVSRASAFGRSETALQLSWVFGGVVGPAHRRAAGPEPRPRLHHRFRHGHRC